MQILYIVGKQKVFYNMCNRKIQVKKKKATRGSPDEIQRNAIAILQGKGEDECSTLGQLQIIRNQEVKDQKQHINISKET